MLFYLFFLLYWVLTKGRWGGMEVLGGCTFICLVISFIVPSLFCFYAYIHLFIYLFFIPFGVWKYFTLLFLFCMFSFSHLYNILLLIFFFFIFFHKCFHFFSFVFNSFSKCFYHSLCECSYICTKISTIQPNCGKTRVQLSKIWIRRVQIIEVKLGTQAWYTMRKTNLWIITWC